MLDSKSQPSLLIAGCGYLGQRVAERWHSAGGSVSVVTRNPQKAEQFAAKGWNPVTVDLSTPVETAIPKTDYAFWAVGFSREGGADRRKLWIDGLNWLINAMPAAPRRFAYTSSTSVYGNVTEEAVTEETTADPVTEGGIVCREAEQLVLDTLGSAGVCLRMAGIYGPDRLLRRIDDLKQQKPLVGESSHWLNLIHVDDAAAVVCHLLQSRQELPAVINVANRPAITRHAYYSKLSDLAETPPPVFGGTSGTGRSRSGNKNVDTLYRTLFPELDFDNVHTGLKDAFRQSQLD